MALDLKKGSKIEGLDLGCDGKSNIDIYELTSFQSDDFFPVRVINTISPIRSIYPKSDLLPGSIRTIMKANPYITDTDRGGKKALNWH